MFLVCLKESVLSDFMGEGFMYVQYIQYIKLLNYVIQIFYILSIFFFAWYQKMRGLCWSYSSMLVDWSK